MTSQEDWGNFGITWDSKRKTQFSQTFLLNFNLQAYWVKDFTIFPQESRLTSIQLRKSCWQFQQLRFFLVLDFEKNVKISDLNKSRSWFLLISKCIILLLLKACYWKKIINIIRFVSLSWVWFLWLNNFSKIPAHAD